MTRPTWDQVWISFAKTISERSYDPRNKVGAVIVTEDNTQVLSIGYNGGWAGGPNEVRAWTLPKGSTAIEAAGTIHSDLARGFIRAETIFWQDLVQLGGFSEAKSTGKLRLEGKEYTVQDGDVLTIRFNV